MSGSPFRVVMLYSRSFEPYEGWYRRVYNEARALVETGCDVTLLAWDRNGSCPEEEVIDGIRIVRFRIPAGVAQGPRNALNHARFQRAVYEYLRRADFDVVHCFNVDTMPCGLLAARRLRKRAVLDLCEPDYYRGFWPKRYEWLLQLVNRVEKGMAGRFDHLFVHNTYQVEKFRSAGISRITQVGSYPNRSLLPDDLEPSRSDVVVVGRFGTAYANNGFEELVAGFGRLLARRPAGRDAPSYRLRLAGNVFDNYRATFDALVGSLGDDVEVTGTFDVADLPRLYREIDISIFLYETEGFGNVTPTKLFESMACGVPVVANAIGDVAEILAEGPCGVIVDERDPESICNGIEKLAADRELRRGMAANAVRLAREKYTWEAARPAFLAAYRGL
jgi:glycosyltransferase involved in cell wall biosynthesis